MRILVLEDEFYRHLQFVNNLVGHVVVVLNNSKNCIEALRDHGPWDVLFLDHDLEGGDVGMKVVNYICGEWEKEAPECDLPNRIVVHSLNIERNKAMMQALKKLPCVVVSAAGNFGKLD